MLIVFAFVFTAFKFKCNLCPFSKTPNVIYPFPLEGTFRMISCLIFIFVADIMTHQPSNNTFQLQYILCFTIAPHLVLKPTSYPLNRATSDSAPKRGQVCQQLIHHAQYQLISKHKQSIFDIRESWTRGARQRKCTYSHYSPAPVCCPLSPLQTGMI